MSESLFLNVFQSSNTDLIDFKVLRLPIKTSDLQSLYTMFKRLSLSGIADCAFHQNSVYFKGDQDRVIESLNLLPNTYIVSEVDQISLSPSTDSILIKQLLYSAFERELTKRKWTVIARKRAIPPFDEKNRELYLRLSDDNIVLFGLKYMFETRTDGNLLLWLDIYAPIWFIRDKRRLRISEIDEELKKIYRNRVLLQPNKRFQKLFKIVNALFSKEIILEFCDKTSISFLKTKYEIPMVQEGISTSKSFQWASLEEPFLRFKYGYSRNPKKLINLYTYSYGVIKEIPVKAIVTESLRKNFVTLFRGIINGFSGKYMSWPSFSEVTGAKILFDEGSDIIEINDDEKSALKSLIEVSGSSEKNTVVFIALPKISHEAYCAIKAEALRRKICTQVILKDTLEELTEFTLMNIATALYAKAGGIPWILKNPLTLTQGLFIGIAFHLDHTKKNIYYGVMEVFDKYGAHLICKARMYKYPGRVRSIRGLFIPRKEAEEILRIIVRDYHPREMIFHKSAPFHEEEKKAIENICNEHDINYCLVHIEGANPYRIYASNQSDYAPLRGTIVFDIANSNRAILTTTGRSIIDHGRIRSWSGIGTPRPLEVTIEQSRGKYSVREISEQILALTKLDWNTTEISVRLPITLKYSRKAARLAKYFKGIEEGLVDLAELKYLI